MESGALVVGFVPIASAALGAGATYLWQVLGNRRIDAAVRAQTNARLLELVTHLGMTYQLRALPPGSSRTLERVISSLDDMQIALAYRRNPSMLSALGQIRVNCDQLFVMTEDWKAEQARGNVDVDRLGEHVKVRAAHTLSITLQALDDTDVASFAHHGARAFGFDQTTYLADVRNTLEADRTSRDAL